MGESVPARSSTPHGDSLGRAKFIVTAVLLAVVAAAVLVLVPLILWNRDALPVIDRQRLREAQQRWDANGPASYDIEVDVTGRQSATYRVEVREGVVRSALRNGRPLRQLRTLGTWSVPGMFATIRADMANVQKVLEGTADRTTPQLTLRGVFDAKYGYPRRYHRVEKVRVGSNPAVSWRVVRFVVVDS